MTNGTSHRAHYATSRELMDLIRYAAETLSLEFTRWDEPHVAGPSLYFLIIADIDFGNYTDPLGRNKWPVEKCEVVSREPDAFLEVAREVAFTRDGAVVVAGDGTVQKQMVRVRNLSEPEMEQSEDVVAASWMGTKHLSALEASSRQQVLWAVTLSEEDGRVTSFRNGSYQDYERHELGGRWRVE